LISDQRLVDQFAIQQQEYGCGKTVDIVSRIRGCSLTGFRARERRTQFALPVPGCASAKAHQIDQACLSVHQQDVGWRYVAMYETRRVQGLQGGGDLSHP